MGGARRAYAVARLRRAADGRLDRAGRRRGPADRVAPAAARADRAPARDEPAARGLGRRGGAAHASGDGPPRGEELERALRRALGDDGCRSSTRPATAAGSTTTVGPRRCPAPGERTGDDDPRDRRARHRRRRPRREPPRRPGGGPDGQRRRRPRRRQRAAPGRPARPARGGAGVADADRRGRRRRAAPRRARPARRRPAAPPRPHGLAPDDPLAARPGRATDAAAELDAAAEEVRAAIAELRELAQGLDPAILREAGLGAAVQSLADRSPVPVEVDLDLDGRLPVGRRDGRLLRRRRGARQRREARPRQRDPRPGRRRRLDLRFEVADDGVGGADVNGAGLRGLVDRVAAVGGTFAVTAPPGGGTRSR